MKTRVLHILICVSLILGALGGWYSQRILQFAPVLPDEHIDQHSGASTETIEFEQNPVFETLSCITESRIAAVRSDPQKGLEVAFKACESELTRKTVSLRLKAEEKKIVFSSILAHSLAPYGPSSSVRLEDLLNDKKMDCDSYAILTGHFSSILIGGDDHIKFAGFDGGAVGNHAQLFVEGEQGGILLDPTIGLVAKVGFDDLLMGRPVTKEQILIFRQHDEQNLYSFVNKVWSAIAIGKYRPSDLLYFFYSLEDYLQFSEGIGPLWGKDTEALVLRFPTPAADALKENLIAQEEGRNR